jgi:hypothetical protein
MFVIRTAALLGVLGLGVAGATAITSYASSNPAPVALDGDHPEIHAAIDALHNAREHLVNADHDYDGHRSAAVNKVDEALAECQACLDDHH